MNEEALKAKLEKTLSDTSAIIGTQFDREVVNSPNVVIMNDPRYKNAFLINDSLYLSFERKHPTNHLLSSGRSKDGIINF